MKHTLSDVTGKRFYGSNPLQQILNQSYYPLKTRKFAKIHF